MTRVIAALALFICIGLPSASFAQHPGIATGASWLTSIQNLDGSWDNATASTSSFYATASVAETLGIIAPTAPQLTNGVAWLQNQSADTMSTTYLAPRLKVLSASGMPTSLDTEKLLSYRNSDGGWGGYLNYVSSNFHTALALQALRAANYPDLSVSNNALAYLTNSQNPDGGWGFSQGDASNIYLTAIVSATLQQFPQTMPLVTALNKSTAFLISSQNADGGYGVNPSNALTSTVFETALTYIALAQGGQTQGAPLQGAIAYLTVSQSLNGSWNDDPYATALALRALYLSENAPGPLPPAPTTGTIMGTVVDAVSGAPVSGVAVALSGVPMLATVTGSGGAFTLNNIPEGGQQLTLVAAGYTPLTLTAQITAGTFINIGKVNLSVNPTSGSVMGTVWDGDANAPFGGVAIEANAGGHMYQATTAADGTFKISVVTPGPITVGIVSTPKPGYWNQTVAGTLATGGIMIFNPVLSTTPQFMKLALHTNKAIYGKGDTVTLTSIHNSSRLKPTIGKLYLDILDPTGVTIYSTIINVAVAASSSSTNATSLVLPAAAQGGFYTVNVETFDDASGQKRRYGVNAPHCI